MSLSNRVLNYQDANNKTVIKLYTTISDSYSGRGLPIEYKGEVLYAPLVPYDDVYASPIKVSDETGDYKIAYDTVGKIQQYYSNKVTDIRLGSSGGEKLVTHGSFSFAAPIAGEYSFVSKIWGGQTGSGYSSDRWQKAVFYLDLDGKNFSEITFRRSQGMGWKTIYNGKISVSSGTHIITLRILGDGSKKDSHQTLCKEWDNKITIIEEG